jgi:hypothetical protein
MTVRRALRRTASFITQRYVDGDGETSEPAPVNLQPKNAFAKPYQVKQVHKVIAQYKLAEGAL